MERGVIYVSGAAFFVDGTGANTLRLAFSLAPGARIVDGVARLAEAVDEELAASGVSSSALAVPAGARAPAGAAGR
jgi:hypothetical protein